VSLWEEICGAVLEGVMMDIENAEPVANQRKDGFTIFK
jgi:hypothetical protein